VKLARMVAMLLETPYKLAVPAEFLRSFPRALALRIPGMVSVTCGSQCWTALSKKVTGLFQLCGGGGK